MLQKLLYRQAFIVDLQHDNSYFMRVLQLKRFMYCSLENIRVKHSCKKIFVLYDNLTRVQLNNVYV